jgi:conjugal transfer/entry exclusion protein
MSIESEIRSVSQKVEKSLTNDSKILDLLKATLQKLESVEDELKLLKKKVEVIEKEAKEDK